MTIWDPNELRDAAERRAFDLDFDWFGVAEATALEEDLERLRTWITAERYGNMQWMARDPERRADPRRVLPGCASVVVVAINYQAPDDMEKRDPPPAGKVSRYARGRDYHRVFEKKLRKLARFFSENGPDGTQAKPYVDYGPVMERQWGARSGLGFIGKNTLLISPSEGSYFFLGVVLTTAAMPPTPPLDLPPHGGCGDCRACLEACPTGAIVAPFELDATRCISYLTIEHSGEIDDELANRMDGWVFGCDVCQDVCPYNRKRARPAGEDRFAPRLLPAEWAVEAILALDEGALRDRLAQSPVKRAGVEQLKRNAHLVAGKKRSDPV